MSKQNDSNGFEVDLAGFKRELEGISPADSSDTKAIQSVIALIEERLTYELQQALRNEVFSRVVRERIYSLCTTYRIFAVEVVRPGSPLHDLLIADASGDPFC